MRKLVVALVMLVTGAYGYPVTMTWDTVPDDIERRTVHPTVDVDYEDECLIIKWHRSEACALVLVTDEVGNVVCSNNICLSKTPTILNVSSQGGKVLSIDIYVGEEHCSGKIQREF